MEEEKGRRSVRKEAIEKKVRNVVMGKERRLNEKGRKDGEGRSAVVSNRLCCCRGCNPVAGAGSGYTSCSTTSVTVQISPVVYLCAGVLATGQPKSN